MGQDRGLWFPPQRLSSLFPGSNPSFALSRPGNQDTSLVSENFAANMVTVCGSSPVYAQMPLAHVGEGDKSHGLVYGLSNSRSRFAPPEKPCLKQISSAFLFKNQTDAAVTPKAGDECAPKRFLVFDQSGDQTTLIFSSGGGKPFEGLTNGSLKRPCSHDSKRGLLRTDDEGLVVHHGMVTREEFAENSDPDMQSEMQEDTEELNALLYSDDESNYSDEDDEVTSSGHSPGAISAHINEDASVGSTDEISPFVDHSNAKKRKLLEGCDSLPLAMPPLNTSISPKRKRLSSEDEYDDAESSCASSGKAGVPPSLKKLGKEKISETLGLLRSIVPGGDMEDPIFVIDRAIDYLKSLKRKAETLGLESLSSTMDA